eukprot:TRINITY_DN946_c0_g1_i6.p1 TRINITY_DN946_c0_g1~~TRINITY_DN946_c0_g1_i6.p1  ORF type:complete len:107 (+),score=12.92 TRINITY_DN946_c0_g1_i6:147-467(+)
MDIPYNFCQSIKSQKDRSNTPSTHLKITESMFSGERLEISVYTKPCLTANSLITVKGSLCSLSFSAQSPTKTICPLSSFLFLISVMFSFNLSTETKESTLKNNRNP